MTAIISFLLFLLPFLLAPAGSGCNDDYSHRWKITSARH